MAAVATERVDDDVLADLYRAEYRSLVRLASLLIDDVGACVEAGVGVRVRLERVGR